MPFACDAAPAWRPPGPALPGNIASTAADRIFWFGRLVR